MSKEYELIIDMMKMHNKSVLRELDIRFESMDARLDKLEAGGAKKKSATIGIPVLVSAIVSGIATAMGIPTK